MKILLTETIFHVLGRGWGEGGGEMDRRPQATHMTFIALFATFNILLLCFNKGCCKNDHMKYINAYPIEILLRS